MNVMTRSSSIYPSSASDTIQQLIHLTNPSKHARAGSACARPRRRTRACVCDSGALEWAASASHGPPLSAMAALPSRPEGQEAGSHRDSGHGDGGRVGSAR